MEKKQLINCTVTSCAYNNNEENKCELQSIQVEPLNESMCASYECDDCYDYDE